jgi:hypothetical protein
VEVQGSNPALCTYDMYTHALISLKGFTVYITTTSSRIEHELHESSARNDYGHRKLRLHGSPPEFTLLTRSWFEKQLRRVVPPK